jgi:hypothetical protein
MKKETLISIAIVVLLILFHSALNTFFLRIGFSWTLAKALPYLLYIIFGFLISYYVVKYAISKKRLKIIMGLILFVLPFSIGFLLNPIYEGDFSLEGKSAYKNASPSDFNRDGLAVIAIADCPHCLASIEKLKVIKERNPNLNIDFIVCTTKKEYIKNYIQLAGNKLAVRIATNADSLASTAGWKFPTFIEIENKTPKYLWSNDQFGVRAIDKVERDFDSK